MSIGPVCFTFPDGHEETFYGVHGVVPRAGEDVLFTHLPEPYHGDWLVESVEHHYGERGLSIVGVNLSATDSAQSARPEGGTDG